MKGQSSVERRRHSELVLLKLKSKIDKLDKSERSGPLKFMKAQKILSKLTLNKMYLIQEASEVICSPFLFSLFHREIQGDPCLVNTTKSGIWWASRVGVKVVVKRNGQAFTPTSSSMWTGFWRKPNPDERVFRCYLTP
jgi:hypothetical protein